jgi:hypothetical protein
MKYFVLENCHAVYCKHLLKKGQGMDEKCTCIRLPKIDIFVSILQKVYLEPSHCFKRIGLKLLKFVSFCFDVENLAFSIKKYCI